MLISMILQKGSRNMGEFRPATATVVGLLVGGLNGFLAAGGTLLVPAMVHVLHLDQRRAHGTSLWVILPTSAVSLSVYLLSHSLDWDLGWKVGVGGVLGGYAGARLMARVSGIWLKRMFAVFMLVAGIRMVFS